MWWIIGIIALLLVAIAAYLYLALTCFFTEVTFMTAYELEYEHSRSRESALRTAMNVFHGRPPFDILSESDMDRLVFVFALVPDPRSVAQIWRHVDRYRDARKLRDPQFLQRLERAYRRLDGPA